MPLSVATCSLRPPSPAVRRCASRCRAPGYVALMSNPVTLQSHEKASSSGMTDQPPIPSSAGTVRSCTPSTSVVLLSVLIAVLALVATTMGLFSGGGDGERTFVTVRGETTEIFGKGLYQHDSIFRAAGNKGSDAVTLVLAIPILLVGALAYGRGSLRGGLVLGGTLTWFRSRDESWRG